MIDNNLNDLWPIYNILVYKSTNEFEVLRELIKRSYTSNASKIEIRFSYTTHSGLCIEVVDDGEEMTLAELRRFFSIDEISNCHNTKDKIDSSILLNCDNIEIRTGDKSSKSYIATLTNIFEKYDAMFIKSGLDKHIKEDTYIKGTKITLTGYDLDNKNKFYKNVYHDNEDFIKKIYNYKRVEDYLLWNTHAGNMKKIFHWLCGGGLDYYEFSGCQPHIVIIDEINNKTIYIDTESIGIDEAYTGLNYTSEDENNIYSRSSNMCYKFKKYYKKADINGTLVSFHLYGYVAGEKYRLSKCNLNKAEKLSNRFGLYLAKDFIHFKKEDTLLDVADIEHYKIVINSENFILNINRNDITNRNTEEVQWILNEAKKIIDTEIIPKSYKYYFKIRNEEEFERKYKNQLNNI